MKKMWGTVALAASTALHAMITLPPEAELFERFGWRNPQSRVAAFVCECGICNRLGGKTATVDDIVLECFFSAVSFSLRVQPQDFMIEGKIDFIALIGLCCARAEPIFPTVVCEARENIHVLADVLHYLPDIVQVISGNEVVRRESDIFDVVASLSSFMKLHDEKRLCGCCPMIGAYPCGSNL